MLLANLRIGYHEQTRLQPEIAEALDAPVADPRDVKARLLAAVFPRAGSRLHGIHGPLDTLAEELTEAVRRRVRAIITAHFMTLGLPGGPLRLGRDLESPCPPSLEQPVNSELIELIRLIDPASGTAGSGAEDWADFSQRVRYIYELFRSRQETASLFTAPFTPEQAEAITAGRVPEGRL
jgi:hypothetical protein